MRLRHALVNQRCPARRQLMTHGRAWLKRQPLGHTAREQITVALAMTAALDMQMAPIDKQLRAFARRWTRSARCKGDSLLDFVA